MSKKCFFLHFCLRFKAGLHANAGLLPEDLEFVFFGLIFIYHLQYRRRIVSHLPFRNNANHSNEPLEKMESPGSEPGG